MDQKPRVRKNYPAYTKAKSKLRRALAYATGKCDSLCGSDVTPGVNHRTGNPYRSCAECRVRQSSAQQRRNAARRLAKGQLNAETTPESIGNGDDEYRSGDQSTEHAQPDGAPTGVDLREASDASAHG